MSSLVSPMTGFAENNPPPVKRKRGRPPKANKLGDAFPTLTLQFETSPSSGSPTAELNSSMTVKMGEPDTFTPLMKVLPTYHLARRKRSRRCSNDLPTRRERPETEIPTPLSSTSSHRRLSYQFDLLVMDKMFSLTHEGKVGETIEHKMDRMDTRMDARMEARDISARASAKLGLTGSGSNHYDKSLQNPGAPTPSGLKGSMGLNALGYPSPMGTLNTTGVWNSTGASKPIEPVHSGAGGSASHNACKGGRIENSASTSRTTHHSATNAKLQSAPQLDAGFQGSRKERMQFVEDDLFTFKLVVNSLGRAELSKRKEPSEDYAEETIPEKPVQEYQPSGSMSANDGLLQKEKPSSISNESQFPSYQSGILSRGNLPEKPPLVHHNTAIGIEGQLLAREESMQMSTAGSVGENMDDGEKHVVPQTPKGRDDFLVGFTPKYEEGSLFKLTPQFNTMMYSMMNLNSPQPSRGDAQPFLSPNHEMDSQARAIAMDSSIDTEKLLDPSGHENLADQFLSKDDGDARNALKKILKLH